MSGYRVRRYVFGGFEPVVVCSTPVLPGNILHVISRTNKTCDALYGKLLIGAVCSTCTHLACVLAPRTVARCVRLRMDITWRDVLIGSHRQASWRCWVYVTWGGASVGAVDKRRDVVFVLCSAPLCLVRGLNCFLENECRSWLSSVLCNGSVFLVVQQVSCMVLPRVLR